MTLGWDQGDEKCAANRYSHTDFLKKITSSHYHNTKTIMGNRSTPQQIMSLIPVNVFAIVWILSVCIIGYHVAHSWDFPWLSNPDQDLVFMRDGLRLFNLSSPGYSDHPGLIQMLAGAAAQILLRVKEVFQDPGIGLPTKTEGLRDADWQNIFRLHKIINGIGMATLIASCSHLISKLFGRLIGFAWGLMASLSMGTVVLTYQIRNEFYSAYFFYAAALLLWLSMKETSIFENGRNGKSPSIYTLLAASGLLYLSLLAKIQILPLIMALNIGLAVAVIRLNKKSIKQWLVSFFKAIGFCLAIAMVIQKQAPSVHSITTTVSVLLLILMPLIFSCQLASQKHELTSSEAAKSWIGFGITTMAYSWIVERFQWQSISWDPYSMSRYKVDTSGTCTINCYSMRVADAISNLFERTFDGLIIAKVACVVLPVMLLIGCTKLNNQRTQISAQSEQQTHIIIVSYLALIAITMSVIASMRWPADHYLPYQQPILFLSILIAAKSLWPHMFWKSLAAYALISLILINFRYPPLAEKTFVKYQPAELEKHISSIGLISDEQPICWEQHAGAEWNRTILRRACKWR